MTTLQKLRALPFEATDDIARVLATIPDAPRLHVLQEAAVAWNVPWLDAALQAGYLETNEYALAALTHARSDDPNASPQHRWKLRCNALMGMVGHYSVSTVEDGYGEHYARLDFELPPHVAEIAEEIVMHVGIGYSDFVRDAPGCDQRELVEAVASAMVLSAMMNRVDLLQHLHWVCPSAVDCKISDACVGEAFARMGGLDDPSLRATPLMFALAFSKTESVMELLKHASQSVELVQCNRDDREEHLDALSVLDVLRLGCLPETYALVLKHVMRKQEEKTKLGERFSGEEGAIEVFRAGIRIMDEASTSLNKSQLSAFVLAGAFEQSQQHAQEALLSAVSSGSPEVVAGLSGKYSWDALHMALSESPSALREPLTSERVSGVVSLLQEARAAGRMDSIMQAFYTLTGEIRSATAWPLATRRGCRPVLSLLLAEGFDPTRIDDSTTPPTSFIALANKKNVANVAMLNSHQAQASAQAAIDVIGRNASSTP